MKRVFLLGGYDLEMVTIRELLDQYQESYFDKHLCWSNATLDAYQKELIHFRNQPDVSIYGVELHPGKFPTNNLNYRLIDHHSSLSDNPSALTQVAKILNIPLNRYQQLIAANDSEYIPGMEKLGASEKEISDIRTKDRQTQGVTPLEEKQAEQDIDNNLIQKGNLILVQTKLSRFSPICDRLYPFKSLLIYSHKEWVLYGEGTEKVEKAFASEIKAKKLFYGGGKKGFIGTPENLFTSEQITQMIKQITTLINE